MLSSCNVHIMLCLSICAHMRTVCARIRVCVCVLFSSGTGSSPLSWSPLAPVIRHGAETYSSVAM